MKTKEKRKVRPSEEIINDLNQKAMELENRATKLKDEVSNRQLRAAEKQKNQADREQAEEDRSARKEAKRELLEFLPNVPQDQINEIIRDLKEKICLPVPQG